MRVPGRWTRGSAICLFVCLSWSLLAGARPPPGASLLPAGFAGEVVASGLQLPTTFAALPDGRILIAEKAGVTV